jgi:lysophospholipase L1-like esterase
LLGGDYEVVNEGLCGRYAGNLDVEETFQNGLEGFSSTYYASIPFKILIISLGTNDFKARLNQSGEDVFNNLMKYVDLAHYLAKSDNLKEKIRVLFISPPTINEKTGYFEGSFAKNQMLLKLLCDNSNVKNYEFLDISDINITSQDGVHFDCSNHVALAIRIHAILIKNT